MWGPLMLRVVAQHGAAGTARAHIRHARGCSHSTWLHAIRALEAIRKKARKATRCGEIHLANEHITLHRTETDDTLG